MDDHLGILVKARMISDWVGEAVSDVAYSVDEDDEYWGKKIKKAKANGVRDIKGWLADELYNDEDTLSDLLGDKVYDEARGDKEIMIKILEEIKRSSHLALAKVCEKSIKRWRKR